MRRWRSLFQESLREREAEAAGAACDENVGAGEFGGVVGLVLFLGGHHGGACVICWGRKSGKI